MADIKDFKCTYDNAAGVNPEVAQKLNLTFPDTYLHADTMVKLAKGLKEYEGASHIEMPFDHAIEAEALGGIINYGDEIAGPRAKEYLTKDFEELRHLPEIDFQQGRMKEVLEACRQLSEEGENVVLDISGPITVLNTLIDVKYLFKAMRKQPDLAKEVFRKVGEQSIRFVKEAEQCGVHMFSYSDSAAGVNILGPQMMEQMVNDFTFDFIKKLLEEKDHNSLILLCPKTTFALIGTDHAEFKDYPLSSKELCYADGCMEVIGKVKMVGQQCIKNVHYQLKNGTIKEVVLK